MYHIYIIIIIIISTMRLVDLSVRKSTNKIYLAP